MSGKPAARQGDAVTCPHCGDTQIATGSPNIFINGLPAARQGDCTACGAELNLQVVANVLFNGRPAVVMGSQSSHDGVVIGGSGSVIIGNQHTPAPFIPVVPVGSHRAEAPPLPPTEQERSSALVAAELEEEEDVEDETPIGITLRIGVFFDGTGNNAANTALGSVRKKMSQTPH